MTAIFVVAEKFAGVVAAAAIELPSVKADAVAVMRAAPPAPSKSVFEIFEAGARFEPRIVLPAPEVRFAPPEA